MRDLNQNGTDDRAEAISSIISAFSPVILFGTSMICLSILAIAPRLGINKVAEGSIEDVQKITLTTSLALINNSNKRRKDENS